jgi:two-component system OmpR family response regulator
MSKVLLVDDDRNLLDVLKYNLVNDGFIVVAAKDGVEALDMARKEKPDIILLDIMLPGIDGFEVCRILRKEMAVPILMLTAKTEEIDKVVGLELGADDYMTKPFSVRELVARLRAMLRRSQWQKQQTAIDEETITPLLKSGSLEVDAIGHRVSRNGSLIQLSPKEFDLLSFLMSHRGQVFNRERLVEKVWSFDYEGTARTVDVHISSLRRKIEENPEKPTVLLTVRGFGYKFEG